MAAVVDEQNAGDPTFTGRWPWIPRAASPSRPPRNSSLSGAEQPSGYTEPILHRRRRELKASLGL